MENSFTEAYDNLIATLIGKPIKKIVLPKTNSKTSILNNWLASDPLIATPHLVKDSCNCESCFHEKSNYMGIIQQKAVRNVFAIATTQAQEEGYTDFYDDSEGAKRRDEIAEAIKRA